MKSHSYDLHLIFMPIIVHSRVKSPCHSISHLVGGFTPSEKYESQFGWFFPICGKIKVMFQSPPTRSPCHQMSHPFPSHFPRHHMVLWSIRRPNTTGSTPEVGRSRRDTLLVAQPKWRSTAACLDGRSTLKFKLPSGNYHENHRKTIGKP